MATTHPKATTITVPAEVRERLREYQIGGKSAAEALEFLMDEVPPDYFRRDLQRALALPRASLDEVRAKYRLSAR